MEKIAKDTDSIKKAVEIVSPVFDIYKVYLFGSFARNQQNDSSDIDLCLETGNNFSLFNAADFSSKIKDLTGRNVDVVTEHSVYPHVKNSMLKERTLLYERV